jgi:DnaJ like chaperone protein
MAWKGKFFGALVGFLITRNVWGAVMGAFIGHFFDQNVRFGYAGAYAPAGAQPGPAGPSSASISEVFFRTTFELMGHIAKSDGRVSEAEIEAARRLMRELSLGPQEINSAIACFRTGKAATYDAAAGVERLRRACVRRHDLRHAFVELQLRAALAGNGISPPARAILASVAERLGISALQLAHMEAVLRARQEGRTGQQGRGTGHTGSQRVDNSLADCYAELGIAANKSDQEVTKAYRRQMSRHHPDKLVANGLPESMAQVAKERTQRIQEAYETIRAARGMR